MAIEFSAQSKQQIDRLLTRYPTKQAALLPVLHVAQEEFGHLPDDVIELVARTLELPPTHVFGVVTFYTMFHREKHGGNELLVCTNVSCMLRGAYDVLKHIERRLGIKPGETTADGAFTLVEEECLAACANAPMMICGTEYYLDLTPQKVDAALDEIKRRWQDRKAKAPAAPAPGPRIGGLPGGPLPPRTPTAPMGISLPVAKPQPAPAGSPAVPPPPRTTPGMGVPVIAPSPAPPRPTPATGMPVIAPPRATPATGTPIVPPPPRATPAPGSPLATPGSGSGPNPARGPAVPPPPVKKS